LAKFSKVLLPAQPTSAALWPALIYAVPTATLLVYTWYNTRPEFHGFDWLTIDILTLPGCAIVDLYFHNIVPTALQDIIGLCLNAIAIFYLARWIYKRLERYRH
jgi:hypothetical protein